MAIITAKLTAEVTYSEIRTDGPQGRRKLLTAILIKAGTIQVANKTVQGRFSQRQALQEFKKNPKGWAIYYPDLARLPIAA